MDKWKLCASQCKDWFVQCICTDVCFSFQPVNLLYKPLSDFQEELLPQDIPLRTIYNVYDEHEHDRQSKTHCWTIIKVWKQVYFIMETIILYSNFSGKLRLCRNERNKIEIAPPSKKSAKKGSGKSPVTRTRSARSPSARGRLTRTLSGSVIVNQSVTGFIYFLTLG